jgi:type II secretory pathway pseudopilin PulG
VRGNSGRALRGSVLFWRGAELKRPGMTPIEIVVAVVVIAILVWMAFDQLRISRQDRDRD